MAGGTNGVLPKALFYASGHSTILPTLGGAGGVANDINNAGNIVGSSGTPLSTVDNGFYGTHAFFYSNGQITDLGVLNGGPSSNALSINSSNQIVGYSNYGNAISQHAFLYANGVMQDLGTMGLDYSAAYDINDLGQVVGYVGTGNGVGYGFLYSGGVMYAIEDYLDSASSNWQIESLVTINNGDWIAGEGRFNGGPLHTVLLTPVPEPSTIALLTLGVFGLLARRRFAGSEIHR
jgi:probable HAF family extracellular repeat protein